MTHALKTWPVHFEAIESGIKNYEIRKDDRPFKVGETLLLQEWNNEKKEYTGKEIKKVISHILRDAPEFGLKNGFAILGLKEETY